MLKPIGKSAIVELFPEESLSPGGIILPETAQEKSNMGIVRYSNLEDVAVGKKVYFSRMGTEIKVNGIKMIILKEDNILAVESDD